MPTIPYSAYLNLINNPRCGFTGGTGPTGPTGPAGPVGPQGNSSGLELYFYTEDTPVISPPPYAPQPNSNVRQGTGYNLLGTPGVGPGSNPIQTGKNGYYAWMISTGYTPTPGSYPTLSTPPFSQTVFNGIDNVLCEFPYALTGKGSIPAGSWTFSVSIFSWNGTNPTTIDAYVFVNVYYWNAATALYKLISNTGPSTRITINKTYTDNTPYTFSINLPNTTIIDDPANDRMYVQFVVSALNGVGSQYTWTTNQQIEFWTEGDFTSQVITSISGAGGTGSTGPTGPTGLPGATGPTGPGFAFTGPTSSILFYNGSAVTGGSNLTTSGNNVTVNQNSVNGGVVHYALNSQGNIRWGIGLDGTGDTGGLGGTTGADLSIFAYQDNGAFSGRFAKLNRGGGITDMIYNTVYPLLSQTLNNTGTVVNFSSDFADNASGMYLARMVCSANPERNNVALVMWIKNAALTILHGTSTNIGDPTQASETWVSGSNVTWISLTDSSGLVIPPNTITLPSTRLQFYNLNSNDTFDITISRIITF